LGENGPRPVIPPAGWLAALCFIPAAELPARDPPENRAGVV